jgi:type III secretion system YscD/HrpQ family protein
MNTPRPPAWCLRFLNGSMRGRTVLLKPGANELGSAAQCDIMLPATEVLPRHLVFSVGELAVAVQRVGTAAARLNGEEMPASRRTVVVGDKLSVGKLEFEIDRSYPVVEHADSMFLDEEAADDAKAALPPPRPPRSRTVLWGGFAALWLVAVVGLWWLFSPSGSVARPASAGVDLAQLEAALSDFDEVEVVAGAAGQVQVKGFVESQVRKRALIEAVQPHGPRVAVNVHSVDDVVDQARRFIADPGVAITYAGKGRLLVSGSSDSASVRQKIQRLGEDLHPTVLVSDKVQYRPQARDDAADARAQWAMWQNLLPGRVVSVTEDAQGLRHIQLANGSRYYEGSVLRSGAELKSLKPDGLTVDPGGSP